VTYTIRVRYGTRDLLYLPFGWNETPAEPLYHHPLAKRCHWSALDIGYQIGLLPLVDWTGAGLEEIVIRRTSDAEA
jgi:hypothetical protein